MSRSYWQVALGILGTLVFATDAAAKVGIVIVTSGDTISHIGNSSKRSPTPGGPTKIGYKYHYWGMFWVDFWTSDGTYCLYDGNRYNPISRAEAAGLLGRTEDELTTPFWYRYPLGLLIITGVVGIVLVAELTARIRRGSIAESRPTFSHGVGTGTPAEKCNICGAKLSESQRSGMLCDPCQKRAA